MKLFAPCWTKCKYREKKTWYMEGGKSARENRYRLPR